MGLAVEGQTFVVCESCKRLNRVHLGGSKSPVCGACKSNLPLHGAVVEASDSTFRTLINKSPLAVVVDVWAPWCGPCRAFAPTFQEFSDLYAGKVVFVKLNSDQNKKVAETLGVRGIPTIMIFKNGAELARQAGAIPRERFGPWLDQYTR